MVSLRHESPGQGIRLPHAGRKTLPPRQSTHHPHPHCRHWVVSSVTNDDTQPHQTSLNMLSGSLNVASGLRRTQQCQRDNRQRTCSIQSCGTLSWVGTSHRPCSYVQVGPAHLAPWYTGAGHSHRQAAKTTSALAEPCHLPQTKHNTHPDSRMRIGQPSSSTVPSLPCCLGSAAPLQRGSSCAACHVVG